VNLFDNIIVGKLLGAKALAAVSLGNAMFGHNELQLKLVTSSRTEKAFDTGKDDDVELFKKN
jgi:hypothetical protein